MSKIESIERLRQFLYTAMQIEHATMPPYLLALYSIHLGTNPEAVRVLEVVVREEMLHLTLAANILNAIGGTPDLTAQNFVPFYPAYLPDGEDDFLVHLQPFSEAAIDTFLQIERPAPPTGKKVVKRQSRRLSTLAVDPGNEEMRYYSIGEFYTEILDGLSYLDAQMGPGLFPPQYRSRQVPPEYYYNGGGEVVVVTDIGSARRAVNMIIQQGEGYDMAHSILTQEGELAHDWRFDQLKRRKLYVYPVKKDAQLDNAKVDTPKNPTGAEITLDFTKVYPVKEDARLSDYQEHPDLLNAAIAFNLAYADFLACLTKAFNGQPKLLRDAVPMMFALRNKMKQLIHNPIPGLEGVNASPTFEMPLRKALP